MNDFPLIKIAIQKRGKLSGSSMEYLASLGLQFPSGTEKLMVQCANANISLITLRDDDIPEMVNRGTVDFGIVGENVLREKGTNVQVVKKLGFGKCRLVLAVPKNLQITKLRDLDGKRIATSYPWLLADYLARENIMATIVPMTGSVEITPLIDLADAICDLTQTGNTLRENNLVEIATVLQSQAVLIASPMITATSPFFTLCRSTARNNLE